MLIIILINAYKISEWTSTLIKFLKDQIPKLSEHYQNPPTNNIPDKTPPTNSGVLNLLN